jgi:hypothetical protein
MPKLSNTQEEVRKKREAEKKEQLDALGGSGNIAAVSMTARAKVAKEIKKNLEIAMKKSRKEAPANAKKRKADQSGTAPAPSNNTKKKNEMTKKAKPPKKPEPKQGQRKVPVPSDTHGCDHYGLLALLPLERTYLRSFVKEGGWLYKKPCYDCAKNEAGGDERVLDVSDLLKRKGDLGVYCNCGARGHGMSQDDEPVQKQQWACNMVLCMECVNRRHAGMGGTGDRSKRTRRAKSLDC